MITKLFRVVALVAAAAGLVCNNNDFMVLAMLCVIYAKIEEAKK